jgi:hypothetical protein
MREIFDRIEGKVTDEAALNVDVTDNLAEIIAAARKKAKE